MEHAILCEGLTKAYGKTLAIEDVSFSVRPGEVFGFLGPNGAGKTTTIRLLLDLLRPTRGKASVLGLETRKDSLEIRRRVGYLPGELGLYEHMTGREFLTYTAHLAGGVDAARVDELTARFHYDPDKPIHALSRGNKQKLGIIQAFMHDPDLLILDEPTSGLDPLMQQAFNDLVAETAAAGRTVFLSSHVLPEVEAVCDRVGIIRAGRLVAVEDVRVLRQKAVRRVTLHFNGPVDAASFQTVPGVQAADVEGHVLSCTLQGPTGPLVAQAVKHGGLVDVETERANLEDVFLAHYAEVPR